MLGRWFDLRDRSADFCDRSLAGVAPIAPVMCWRLGRAVHAEDQFGQTFAGADHVATQEAAENLIERVVFTGVGKPEGFAFEPSAVDQDGALV